MTRKKLNVTTETIILLSSRRRCCLCFGLDHDIQQKAGQIAHLDRNPSNNEQDNLAYLCLNHHNQYDASNKQSKNITMSEAKEYRKQLYKKIDTLWKQPVTFDKITTELNENISGHYIRDGEYSNAELDIHYLGDNKVKVQGFALWGKTRECGPNIGELDFETELKSNIIYFKHAIGDKEYQIKLELTEDGLKATEKYIPGYFGMNVSFQGDYQKT
ncbi:MAG: hypothetical protein ABII64_04275 [Elusimicrobiota bacterium]